MDHTPLIELGQFVRFFLPAGISNFLGEKEFELLFFTLFRREEEPDEKVSENCQTKFLHIFCIISSFSWGSM